MRGLEIVPGYLLVLVRFKMGLEFVVPSFHSVDLELVITLTGALGDVSFGPFSVSSGDLLGSDGWVLTVVSVPFIVGSSLSVGGSSMGKLIFVVMATSLLATLEGHFHTIGIICEFVNPFGLRWKPAVPLVEKLFRELGQT